MFLLKLLEPVRCSRQLVDPSGNLSTSDQTDHNAGSDDEGQDEAVRPVPWGRPAAGRRAAVDGVEEVECQELRDQSILDGQQHRRPCNSGCGDANGITWIPAVPSVARPFKTPVDGAEE